MSGCTACLHLLSDLLQNVSRGKITVHVEEIVRVNGLCTVLQNPSGVASWPDTTACDIQLRNHCQST